MPLVEWKPEYSVGIDAFDDDHRQLFSLLNQAYASVSARQGDLALNHILRELAYYAQTHFRAEEALMKRYGYPELPAHKAKHDYFTAQIAQFSDHFQSGQVGLIIEVTNTLQLWLTEHILQYDLAYASYYRSKDGENLPDPR